VGGGDWWECQFVKFKSLVIVLTKKGLAFKLVLTFYFFVELRIKESPTIILTTANKMNNKAMFSH